MTDDAPVLNLDELFGQRERLRVIWEGRDYYMRRPEDLGPLELVKIQRLNVKLRDLAAPFEVTEEAAETLDDIHTAILDVLCAELAAQDLPFLVKMRTNTWYNEQCFPKAARAETGA